MLEALFEEVKAAAVKRKEALEQVRAAFEAGSLCEQLDKWLRSRLAHYQNFTPSGAMLSVIQKLNDVCTALHYTLHLTF